MRKAIPILIVISVLPCANGQSTLEITQNGSVVESPTFPYRKDSYQSWQMAYLRSIADSKHIFVKAGTGTFNKLTSVVQGGQAIDMTLAWKDREWDIMRAIVWYISNLMTFTGIDTASGLFPDDYYPVPISPTDPDFIPWTDARQGIITIPTAIRARQNSRRFGWSCGTIAAATASLAMSKGIPARLVNGHRITYDAALGHDVFLGGDFCCELYSTKFNRWIFFFPHSFAWFEDRSLGDQGEPIGIRELAENDHALANSIELFTDGRPGVGDYPNGQYIEPPTGWVAYLDCGYNEVLHRDVWTWVAAAKLNARLRFAPERVIPIPGTSNVGFAMLPPSQDCEDTRTYGTSATVGWWHDYFRYMTVTYTTRLNTGLSEDNIYYDGCDLIMTEENPDTGFTVANMGYPLCSAESLDITYPLNNVEASTMFVDDNTVQIGLKRNMTGFWDYQMRVDSGPWHMLDLEQPDPSVELYLWHPALNTSTLRLRGVNFDGVHSPDIIISLVPSICDGLLHGDLNHDLKLDGADIQQFCDVLEDPNAASPQDRCLADLTLDGEVDQLDLSNFVEMLLAF